MRVELSAADDPQPPDIMTTPADSNSVEITWQVKANCSWIKSHGLEVFDESHKTHYELTDCVEDMGEFNRLNTSQCLPQIWLAPCTQYQIQISTEFDGNNILRSDPVNVTTLPSEPSL
jgi:hypothetical protein